MLNDYFSSQTLINDQNKHLRHLDLITDKTLEDITVSEQEVRGVLENLFSRSLQQGYFPPLWKDGYLTLFTKKTTSLHRQIIDLSLFYLTNSFSTIFKITNYSLPFSQDSLQQTLRLISYYIPTIPSVRLLILGKK